MTRLFLGVDIGSSATKAVLVEEGGALVATARREHEISRPRPDWAEMDAERDWWGGAVEVIHMLLRLDHVDPGRIAAVGVCGIGASFVPVGERDEPLRPAILYGIDSRASGIVSALRCELGDEALLAATGRLPSAQSVGPKLNWLRHHEPALWARTRQILTPTAMVAQRLCGSTAIDYHSALSFDPLFDAPQLRWNEAMCERLLGPALRLPRLTVPGACVGEVHAQAAGLTGLPSGIPIACGTADVVAEAVGAGVRDAGDLLVMYGSTLFLLQRVPAFAPAPPLWPSLFLDPAQPTWLAGTSNAGSLLAWAQREFASSRAEFDVLLRQASLLPAGADGLLCLPYFSGERAPIFDPQARGMFLGLSGRHTRAHLVRALVEGISLGFRHLVEAYVAHGAPPRRLLASGGGVQVDLWAQTMSDVLGTAQQAAPHGSGAAVGAAFLGAQAAGLHAPGDPMPQDWLAGGRLITPRADRAHYDALYQDYLEAYEATRPLMHRLAGYAAPAAAG